MCPLLMASSSECSQRRITYLDEPLSRSRLPRNLSPGIDFDLPRKQRPAKLAGLVGWINDRSVHNCLNVRWRIRSRDHDAGCELVGSQIESRSLGTGHAILIGDSACDKRVAWCNRQTGVLGGAAAAEVEIPGSAA